MLAQSTFFHQGSDLFEDIDPFLKTVGVEVSVSEVACSAQAITFLVFSGGSVARANKCLGKRAGESAQRCDCQGFCPPSKVGNIEWDSDGRIPV